MKTKPKKKSGRISCHMVFDLEDGELDTYMDIGDEPLPPFIKPKIKPKNAQKKRRPS